LTWFEIRRVTAVGIHQRRKSNFIKDFLVKIARREHLEIIEGDTTPFSIYASAWLERKKATLARSTYGDYRSIWRKYVLPYFGEMPLCRVTRLDVEEFLANLPDISAKRKNNIMVGKK
jgi:Phage integrase, N-terminal SAM-like domain